MTDPARRLFRFLRRANETRRLARAIAKRPKGERRLHLGCGPRRFDGWINIDRAPHPDGPPPDVRLDLTLGLPIEDGAIDAIYSEDLIEHLDRDSGRRLLSDCYRVLRPGGVMRVLTPDLRSFAQSYIDRREEELAWYRERFGCATFGEMFNAGMREWGHKFLYDEETLRATLESIGFEALARTFNQSDEPRLRGLDSRDRAAGSHSMYFDCYRP